MQTAEIAAGRLGREPIAGSTCRAEGPNLVERRPQAILLGLQVVPNLQIRPEPFRGTAKAGPGRRPPSGRIAQRTRQRHAAIHERLAQGQPLSLIAAELGLPRNTVRRFARAASPGELPVNDWSGSYTLVSPVSQTPKARKVTGWIMSHPDNLTRGARCQLTAILAACPELAAVHVHVTAFADIMTRRRGRDLEKWITDASTQPLLRPCADGLRRDQDAVTAGLTLPGVLASWKATSTASKCGSSKLTGAA